MKQININSRFKDYNVYFVNDLKQQIKLLIKKNNTHFFIDKNIYSAYKNLLIPVKSSNSLKLFDAVEENKNLNEVFKYIKFLLKNKVQKTHKIVVVGGGLVQDIGSFSAHIILRGIDWIFIPTTLLSMADSCIGSKSGINSGKYKNQIGSFHAPSEIYIYSKFLKTLPKTDILNGIGEIIKHGLIKGGLPFNKIKDGLNNLQRNQKIAEEIIYQSLLIKKEVIEEDEYEKGVRKLLNYGHTFGHALEGYSKNKIPHGIGVSIGMDIANFISLKRGLLSQKEFNKISKLIRKHVPYKKLEVDDINSYLNFLKRDKKVVGDEVSAILCKGLGKIEIIKTKLDKKLTLEISEYFRLFNSTGVFLP